MDTPMTKRSVLEKTDLFVLDLDGTFYIENDILPGSLDFLDAVKKAGKDYVFFTNNASQSPTVYIDKLAKMNCPVTRKKIMTSGDVTLLFLKETVI